jgi:hypothetical protein
MSVRQEVDRENFLTIDMQGTGTEAASKARLVIIFFFRVLLLLLLLLKKWLSHTLK